MLTLRSAERQWKKAAAEALSPAAVLRARERWSAELARQIWRAQGGQAWAESSSDGALLSLEALIAATLEDALVRCYAALRYLQALADTLRRGDYEDVRTLRQELRWSVRELLPLIDTFQGETVADERTDFGALTDTLVQTVLARVQAALKAAEIAA